MKMELLAASRPSGPAEVRITVAPGPPSAQRRRVHPPFHGCLSSTWACTLYAALATVLAPAGVLTALELGHVYVLIYVAQVLLAVMALEWSWMCFRIRTRVLFALEWDDATNMSRREEDNTGEDHREQSHQEDEGEEPPRPVSVQAPQQLQEQVSYEQQLRQAMDASSDCAITAFSHRFCKGKWIIGVMLMTVSVIVVALVIMYFSQDDVLDKTTKPIAWHMMLGATLSLCVLSVSCSSLAPSLSDATVLVVYQCCFCITSMNSFLWYYAQTLEQTDFIDPLFVVLVGAVVIMSMRVVTSKDVMGTVLLVMTDTLGLVILVLPMVLFGDFIVTPKMEKHRNKICLFLFAIYAAELGLCVVRIVRLRADSRKSTHHKTDNSSGGLNSFLAAMICAAAVVAVARFGVDSRSVDLVESLFVMLAVAVGQQCLCLLTQLKEMAKISSTAFYISPERRYGGLVDHMTLFLVATIVYHPYLKHVVYA